MKQISLLILLDDSFSTIDVVKKEAQKSLPEWVVLNFCSITDSIGEASDILTFEEVKRGLYDLVITIGNVPCELLPVFLTSPVVMAWNEADDSTLAHHFDALGTVGALEAIVHQRKVIFQLIDGFEEGLVAHDLNRRVFLFSAAAEKITGLKKEDVLGRDCHEVFPPSLCGGECTFCSIDDLEPITCKSYPVVFHSDEMGREELKLSVSPLKDFHDNTYGVLVAIKNETHEKEMERRLGDEEQFHRLMGNDNTMRHIYEVVRNAGAYDFPVLVHGESGTGKELIADAIHQESKRKGLFVPVNCGAIPEGTIESELFGHEKGAFTGAVRTKKGRFELAEGGTIFLDEIGEMPLSMQVKLLRVLQEGVIQPVGSEREKKIDVRVVSATNKNLREMVEEGTFREDLYYRLAVVPIEVPPLRDRNSDILLLAEKFLKQIGEKFNRENLRLSQGAKSLFMSYQWPGNVRQLLNAIQYAMIKCTGEMIEAGHLPPEITASQGVVPIVNALPSVSAPATPFIDDDETLGRGPALQRSMVVDAIVKAGGNKAKAARILRVGRTTLYNYLKRDEEIMKDVAARLVH